MRFTKMHGAGNDYIYIDGFAENTDIESLIPFIPKLSDRHKGIGSDGVVFILPSKSADLEMRMFNSDGSEAQMCGNAIRCVGKYAYEKGILQKTECKVQTKAGIKTLFLHLADEKVSTVTVDMGKASFHVKDLPMLWNEDFCLEKTLDVLGKEYNISCVSVGNPHAIIFVNDVEEMEISKVGSAIEHHKLFPERVNVEFVQILSRSKLRMRVWERGAGETEACGTGACAVAAISEKLGYADKKTEIVLNGGSLCIELKEDGQIFMTGEAKTVFEGEINVSQL